MKSGVFDSFRTVHRGRAASGGTIMPFDLPTSLNTTYSVLFAADVAILLAILQAPAQIAQFDCSLV
jgi:hypothetical protein